MLLYHFPGSCSFGIRIILIELGIAHEISIVNLRKGEQTRPEFLGINPKGKLPVLVRGDGTVMTEYGAISWWLAATDPARRLLPDDAGEQARILEIMEYVVGTIHAQGFMRMWFPKGFSPATQDHEKVAARGRQVYEAGLRHLDGILAGRQYAVGRYSIADIAMFYVMDWAVGRFSMPLPENCAAFHARLSARPAVREVLEADAALRAELA